MHILIATVGTRGDAQPYVALGVALQRRGHRVTLVTHDDHRGLAEAHGLGFRAANGSFKALLESPAGAAWLESGKSPARYMETFRALFQPLGPAWIEGFDANLGDADAVLVHSFAMGALVAARRRGLPMVVLSPFSVVPSREVDALGHLHLVSPTLLPRPSDWPAHAEVTGFCFLDAPPSWAPDPKLEAFLAAGEPPIYVGFGSMTGMAPEALAELTRTAVEQAGQRAVVAMGWGGMRGFEDSERTLVVSDVPHDWLFPRVTAVVHHCGAGTTAAALRAGRPSVAVPFFGDQPGWAQHLARLGATPAPVPKQRLTSERLAGAIRAATTDPRFRTRAEELGARIRAEAGAERSAERALHHLERARAHPQASPGVA